MRNNSNDTKFSNTIYGVDNNNSFKSHKNWLKILPYIKKFFDISLFNRSTILNSIKQKSGIYLWYNKITNKFYIGQSKDLKNKQNGRITRYFVPSYIQSIRRGKSIIRNSILKYNIKNFVLVILEYCDILELDKKEEYWIKLLEPEYNILKFAKSSKGYKHTKESLLKMRGPRPKFSPSIEHRMSISKSVKLENLKRKLDTSYSKSLIKTPGLLIYVYDLKGNLLLIFPSINEMKKVLNINLHHNTIKKRISEGWVLNNNNSLTTGNLNKIINPFLILSFKSIKKIKIKNLIEKSTLDFKFSSLKEIENNIKYQTPKYDADGKIILSKKIKLINKLKPELSSTVNSLLEATKYIKKVDSTSDRVSIRKCLNSNKLYKKKWLIIEIK